MAFHYTAVEPNGKMRRGTLDVDSQDAALEQLRREGLLPLRVASASRLRTLLSHRGSKSRGRDCIAFFRPLAMMLSAGVSLDRAIGVLARGSGSRAMRAQAERFRADMRAGGSFASAIDAAGRDFPSYFAGVVKIGETSGQLPLVLTRLANQLEASMRVAERLRSAMIYPAILIVTTIATLILMVTFVLPQFESIFREAGSRLPWAASWVLAAGTAFRDGWWVIVAFLVITLLGMQRWLRVSDNRVRWDAARLNWPYAGPLLMKLELMRLGRLLGTLLESGVQLAPALGQAREAAQNSAIAEALRSAERGLREGRGFAQTLAADGVLPDLFVQVIRVGEETGRLGPVLSQIADNYHEDAMRAIDDLVSIIVPLTTLVLGAVVAAVIGAVFSAMMSIYDLPI